MRLNCRSAVLVALVSLPLVACGGDDDGGGVVVPDAKVFMDAPADTTAACVIPASLPGGTLGSDMMRQSADWIRKTMNGSTFFSVSIPLDSTMKNILTFVAIKSGADWTTNTAINFDPNPTSQTPAALAIIDENYNAQTQTSDRTLWASSGSITFTEIAQTAGAKITFSTTAANFREVDANGADVAGGCTTTAGVIQAFLQQKTAVAIQPPQQDGATSWRNVMFDRVLQ